MNAFPCPACGGRLMIARLQWSYAMLRFDPTAYVPQDEQLAPEASESVFPMDRADSAFEEAEDDELGDIHTRQIECESCGLILKEDAEELIAHARALAAAATGGA